MDRLLDLAEPDDVSPAQPADHEPATPTQHRRACNEHANASTMIARRWRHVMASRPGSSPPPKLALDFDGYGPTSPLFGFDEPPECAADVSTVRSDDYHAVDTLRAELRALRASHNTLMQQLAAATAARTS
jgi:hypothetical protein